MNSQKSREGSNCDAMDGEPASKRVKLDLPTTEPKVDLQTPARVKGLASIKKE